MKRTPKNRTPFSKLTAAAVDRESVGSSSRASACSAARGYETFIKGAELTMRFDTNEDAVAFFDWVMANTHHKKHNASDETTPDLTTKDYE